MKTLKKIFFFFAIAISILIVREFISIYNDLYLIDKWWAYSFVIFIILITIYFVLIPLGKIFILPRSYSPVYNMDEYNTVLKKRLKLFASNAYLKSTDLLSAEADEENYKRAIAVLEKETDKVRRLYVSRVFYSTAVSQNGFLDAIIILSASINLIKEIFIIYNGRVSNKDLFGIGRKIYTAVAIGGSEGVEYASDEIFTSLASDGLKSIPFIDKIMGSLADGFVNAMLLTRISYITENYCKMIYIKNDKELMPSFKIVYDTAKIITGDVRGRIKTVLKNMPLEKKENFAKFATNPTGYVLDSAVDDNITQRMIFNPLSSGLDKIAGLFRRKAGG